jgi:hypothetical protein
VADDGGKPTSLAVPSPATLVTGQYPTHLTVSHSHMTDIGPLAAATAKEVAHIAHVKPIAVVFGWVMGLLPCVLVSIGLWGWFAKKVLDLDPISTAAGFAAISAALFTGGVVATKLLSKKKDD